MDTQRGVLANADPRTLQKRGEPVPIAVRLAANTATVDDNGRLWVIDNGALTSLTPDGQQSTTKIAPGGKAVITIAGGRPVVVDTTSGKAITIDQDGDADREFGIELRDSDTSRPRASGPAKNDSNARILLARRTSRKTLQSRLPGRPCRSCRPSRRCRSART